ncbi:hypothetical protein VUS68_31620, partial [Pseudomonas aeruginosa]|uniref:hypothetical protein n=1 Tax=Pseudomonas aeruginosa TaxID=287 RepID=UPI0030070289
GFGPELTASEVLHLRLDALDGHYFALAAISALVQVFPDLARLHFDSFVMLSAVSEDKRTLGRFKPAAGSCT